MKRVTDIFAFLLMLFLACSCRKPAGPVVDNSGPVSVRGGNELLVPDASDYYSLFIESKGEGWTCTNSSDWLTLNVKEGSGSMYLDFSVTRNRNKFPRVTFIHIADKNDPGRFHCSVRVTQSSMKTIVWGTLTGDMERKHRLGFGYNITGEYMNDSSFSKLPILSYSRIAELEKSVGDIITENLRNTQEIELFSGVTLTEITVKMTEKKSSETEFLGFGKTTESSTELFSRKTDTQECGIVRLKRIVSSRTVDKGMLLSQNLSIEPGADGSTLLDPVFCQRLREMLASPQENMRQFFNDYGTHLVSSADLGGVLELYTVIDRSTSTETRKSVESVSRKLFGVTSGKSVSNDSVGFSEVKYKADLKVYGGQDSAKDKLWDCIDSDGQITSMITEEAMNEWQNSMLLESSESFWGPKYNAALVDCQIIPLYELMTDPQVRDQLEELTHQYLGTRKPNDRDEQVHGSYQMEQAAEKYRNSNNHAVQVVYPANGGSDDDNSVGVVCREYVPAIRTDKSCVVVYPMVNGYPYLYCGLFVGDENNRPGRVRWNGNQCVYEPNDSISRDNPKFSDWFNDEGMLRSVYFYWSSVHPAPEKQKNANVAFVSREGHNKLTGVYRSATYSNPLNNETVAVSLVKVGPLFWSQRACPAILGMVQWRWYQNRKPLYFDFNPGTGAEGYYSVISNLMDDGSIHGYHSYIFINGLPTESQARSLMQIVGGRTELLEYGEDGTNGLGLIWPKGVYSVPFEVPGEDKLIDSDAIILPICEPNPKDEMDPHIRLIRIGQSGRAAKYTLEQYCLTIPDCGPNMYKYFPVFTATDHVR